MENIHWEVNEEDLRVKYVQRQLLVKLSKNAQDLFTRIGPIVRLSVDYDRAGRSTGTAYVTYRNVNSAREAIREYDGANAKGQPIRLTLVPSGPAARRNPFDTAEKPGRSLFDRIDDPRVRGGSSRDRRQRSRSPRRSDVTRPAPDNIDRYVPSPRSRSPAPRRRGDEGRRAGDGRRGEGNRRGDARRRGGDGERNERPTGARPKVTQEDLDREMYGVPSTANQNYTNAQQGQLL